MRPERTPDDREMLVAAERLCYALRMLRGVLFLVFWTAIGMRSAHADTFPVSTTTDGVAGSLREAITFANAHPGLDTITVPAGTYFLTVTGKDEDDNATGDLDVADDLVIVGAGRDATLIDGSGNDRVLQVVDTAAVRLEDLTIQHGTTDPLVGGAGILAANHGPLTLIRVGVRDNDGYSGAGIEYFGHEPLTIIDSEITGNIARSQIGNGSTGGGVYCAGPLVMSGTLVSKNDSILGNGGGIAVDGASFASPALITNSTIEHNHTGNVGGGILHFSNLAHDSPMTLRYVTIADNSQDSNSEGAGLLTETQSGLGGAGVTIQGSILSNNFETGMPTTPANCGLFTGATITSADGNRSDDGTCAQFFTGMHDANADAGLALGALADNGGPTKTRALGVGSSAIDAAPCIGGLPGDQRNFGRPAGAGCDGGAFERAAIALPPTTTTTTTTSTTSTTTESTTTTTTETTTTDTSTTETTTTDTVTTTTDTTTTATATTATASSTTSTTDTTTTTTSTSTTSTTASTAATTSTTAATTSTTTATASSTTTTTQSTTTSTTTTTVTTTSSTSTTSTSTSTTTASSTTTTTLIVGDCPATPDDGCRAPVVARKGLFELRKGRTSATNLLRWRWQFGAATTLAEFGDPTTSTDYRLCVYGPGGLMLSLPVEAGGTCNGHPCWSAGTKSFRYRNVDGADTPVLDVILRAGASRKATATFSARGGLLAVPPLPFTLPATVQLRADTGVCWTTTHSTAGVDTARDLRSRSD